MNMNGDQVACGGCRFWQQITSYKDNTKNIGECRQSSPIPEMSGFAGNDTRAIWPRTNEDDWCGEHEGKL